MPWEALADLPGPGFFDALPVFVRIYRQVLRGLFRRMRRAGGGSRRGRRRQSIQNTEAGRNIRLVPYRQAENLFAPLPTILEALRAGPRRRSIPMRLRRNELRGWAKAERESLTLILLVDVSRSCVPYLGAMADLLQSLAGHFHRNSDRMGLVAIQGRQAHVLHHPTHNYRVVTRHLAQLRFGGETPLADGLKKALATARRERLKTPGSQSLVVLLSDCCPEPIEGTHDDLFDEPMYRDARSAARLYRREATQLLVLLPTVRRRHGSDMSRPLPGERLAAAMVQAAGGRLVSLPTSDDERPSRQQVDRVLGAIESMFALSGRSGMERVGQGSGGLSARE